MKRNKLGLSVLLISFAALAAYCPAQQRELLLSRQVSESNTPHILWVRDKLGKFAEKWAEADEDARDEIQDEAMAVLSKQFDSDFEKREKAVEQLEKRLAKLKQQLDRRANKKDQIVKLRLQQLTMNWEGLGWGDGERGGQGGLFSLTTANQNPFSHNHQENLASTIQQSVVVDFDDEVDLDMDELRSAADDKVEQIVGKYLDSVSELDPNSANEALWDLVTEDELELSDELWLKAAKIAEKAADKIKVTSSPGGKANTLDTAAHLYHNAGDIDKALKLQELAVELNPDSQLQEYLRALKFTKKEMSVE